MKSPNNSNYSRSGTRKVGKSNEILFDGKVQQFNADLQLVNQPKLSQHNDNYKVKAEV